MNEPILTPCEYGRAEIELADTSAREDGDKHPVQVGSFDGHPTEGGQHEIVDQSGHYLATYPGFCPIDHRHEENQQQQHGDGEIYKDLRGQLGTQVSSV